MAGADLVVSYLASIVSWPVLLFADVCMSVNHLTAGCLTLASKCISGITASRTPASSAAS